MEERDTLSHPQKNKSQQTDNFIISYKKKRRSENSLVSFGNKFTNFLLIPNGKFALFSSLVCLVWSGHRKNDKRQIFTANDWSQTESSPLSPSTSIAHIVCVCVWLCVAILMKLNENQSHIIRMKIHCLAQRKQ